MKKIVIPVALISLLLVGITCTYGQNEYPDEIFAFLHVYVSDSVTGEPLEGMTVNVGPYTGTTASFGLIIFAIADGTYDYEVVGSCDYLSKSGTVTLPFGQTITLYVELAPVTFEYPTNFTATTQGDYVLCTWEVPNTPGPSYSLIGYNLFWDDNLINSTIITDTFYLVYPQLPDIYWVCAESVFLINYEDTCYSGLICDTVYFTFYSDIYGTVTDIFSSNPIEGAVVKLGGHIDTTNYSGEFELPDMPYGTYEFLVIADSYLDYTIESFEVDSLIIEHNIELTPILPPQNLTGYHDGGFNYLSWSPPFTGEEWIPWDNGITTGNSVGLTDERTIHGESRRDPSHIPIDDKNQDIGHTAKNFLGYNIYRSVHNNPYEKINDEPVMDTTFMDDEILPYPTWYYYEYYVTALFDEGESEPSNILTVVIIGTETYHGEDQNLIVYPNPADELLNVKFKSQLSGDVVLELINASGHTVYQKKLTDYNIQNVSINVENLRPAIYFLMVKSTDFSATRKVMLY